MDMNDGFLKALAKNSQNNANDINTIKGSGWTNETVKGNSAQIASFANKYFTDDFYIPAKRIDSYASTMEDLTAAEIYAKWDALIAEFPDIMTKTLLGVDASGTLNMYEINISPPNALYKLIVIANQHGNDEGGDPTEPAVALYEFIKDVYYNYSKDKICKWIYNNVKFVILPVANPWGVDNKDRLNSGTVDLNRNYAYCYDNDGSGLGGPFSEEETQYIRWLLISNLDADGFIDIHAYGASKTTYKYPALTTDTTGHGYNTVLKVAEYLAEKYGTTADVDATTLMPAAKNYAKEIAGIESATLEFPVYTANVLTHGSDMMTRIVEWYGNVLYAWCKGLVQTAKVYNLAVYNPDTWEEWKFESSSVTEIVNSKLVFNGQSTSKTAELNVQFKESTKYGFLIKSESNTISEWNGLRIGSNLTGTTLYRIVLPEFNGISKYVLTTQAEISSFPNTLRLSLAVTAASGSLTVSQLRIFELPTGSQIDADFTNLTAVQLDAKYPA